MHAAEAAAHAMSLVHGVAASLVFAACLFLVGSAVVPRRWHESLGQGESPTIVGAALFVVVCWFGAPRGVRVDVVALGLVASAVVIAAVRHGWLVTAFRSGAVFGRDTRAWVLGFIVLYTLAYSFTRPPVTGDHLPIAWTGNVDLLTYLGYTRHLLYPGPSDAVAFDYGDFVYRQTPGLFHLFGGFSLLFGADPMRAAMPAQFALTGLIGVVAARISHGVFGLSRTAAVAIACILISGPFFRYVAGAYFLSTLMSAPVLLYLLWTTVTARPRRWLEVPLAVRFGSAYVLLLFIYPFLFFAGLAAQLGAVALRLAAGLLSGHAGPPSASRELSEVEDSLPPSARQEWREAVEDAGRTICAVVGALGVLALGLRARLAWSASMVGSLSQPGVAGWPLDLISPAALLGLPGSSTSVGLVGSPTGRVGAIGVIGATAAALALAYFWRFRARATPAQQALAGLTGGALILYGATFIAVGPSYQQWKFASYSVLPLSFVVFAGGLHLWQESAVLARITRTAAGRHLVTAFMAAAAIAMVGGNLAAHASSDPPLLRFTGAFRRLALVDAMPSFREMSIQMVDDPADYPTRLALYYLPSKRVHVVSAVYRPNVPLALDRTSRQRPHFIQGYGCEGVGHDDTMTVPGLGCLLLAPPSLAVDTVYPFSLSFLFVEPGRMGDREPEGRWNVDSTVLLNLTADPRRVGVAGNLHVNLHVRPYLTADTPRQRAAFSWGVARRAEATLTGREWISLPVQAADWTGDRLWTLSLAIDLPDGVDGSWLTLPVRRADWSGRWTVAAPVDIPPGLPGRLDRRPLAVMFEELSVSVVPRGRVVAPALEAGDRR
jgi:hypothetical protein